MTAKERNRIIDYIKAVKPRSTGHKILSQDDYIDGKVAKVEYSDSGTTICQWVVITRRYAGYADSESQLIQQMESASTKERVSIDWINQVFNISGFIALILVSAFVYLTINNPDGNVPEHLKASVLTIIGFYFGGLLKGKKNQTAT